MKLKTQNLLNTQEKFTNITLLIYLKDLSCRFKTNYTPPNTIKMCIGSGHMFNHLLFLLYSGSAKEI